MMLLDAFLNIPLRDGLSSGGQAMDDPSPLGDVLNQHLCPRPDT